MQETTTKAPQFGQHWAEQGGIYIGDRVIDGALHHIIVAGSVEEDIVDVSWRKAETILKAQGEIGGHNDWRVPDQRDLMLAYVNTPDLFDKDDWYWSSTQCSELSAWAVHFENGYVTSWSKNYDFRVRPFRSIIASTL